MDLHTGTPFWPRRDGQPFSYLPLRGHVSADVAIVGAGITGALVACALANAGASVVVLDRGEVGLGSSSATTGLLLYDTDASLEELARSVGPTNAVRAYQLGLEAISRLGDLCKGFGSECGFSLRPSLYLASRRRDVAALRREFDERLAHGFDVEWLEAKAIRAQYSFSAPAAIRARGTAEVDCYQLTHQLLAAAARAGARIYDHTDVGPPAIAPGRVTLYTGTGFSVSASRAVWATGYEAATLLKRDTGHLASTWVFVSEPIETFAGWPDRCLIWETARPYFYVRSTDDGRLLVGGEDEPCAECHRSAWWFATKTRRLLRRVRKMFPGIHIAIDCAWAGTFATTRDGLPFIGSVGEWPGVWFALGYGGNGITFSAIAADLIRDAYLGRDNPDAAMFSFDRAGQKAT